MKSANHILAICLLISNLAVCAAETAKQPIGRLFFTPTERASLDIIRQNSKAPDKVIKAEETAIESDIDVEAVAKPAPVTLNGYVSRSDGKNTVWVNNRAAAEKSTVGNINVGKLQTTTHQVQVSLSGSGKAVNLKPGQIYDPASGQTFNYMQEIPEIGEPEIKQEQNSLLRTIEDKLELNQLKQKIVDLFSPDAKSTTKPIQSGAP